MPEAARYSATEVLRDGSRVEIRALRPEDRRAVLAAVDHTSERSLYRRFFAAKRSFTEREIAFFVNVDFTSHVALVAVVKHDHGGEKIVGGGRYVMLQPGRAEAAFTVVDQFQGRGLGTVLLRHLAAVAGEAGIHELVAEVLPDNTPMLEVFEHSGFPMTSRREHGVVHVALRLR
jgi:RimJ/RimL family protein N-acetyltransferase